MIRFNPKRGEGRANNPGFSVALHFGIDGRAIGRFRFPVVIHWRWQRDPQPQARERHFWVPPAVDVVFL